MAKKKGASTKPSQVADPGMDLLTFGDKALPNLTKKIEKGFGKAKEEPGTSDTRNSREEAPKKTKDKEMKAKGTSASAKSKPARGTKRDREGNAKSPVQETQKAANRAGKRSKRKGNHDRDVMLEEILALGGTKEDFDLVADAATDEEDDAVRGSGVTADKSLQEELAKFVAGLGINGEMTADLEDQDDLEEGAQDDQDEEEADEWEETSDLEASMADVPPQNEVDSKISKVIPVDNSSVQPPGKLQFEARPDWHAAELPTLPSPLSEDTTKYSDVIKGLKGHAQSLLEADSNLYASKHLKSSSSHRFLSTIMTSGTLSDKVSALTLVVQESPVHTRQSFESLLALAKKRSRGQAVTALGAMKDLLATGVVLPADRRLRAFGSQPGLLGTIQEESVTKWIPGQKLPGHITAFHLISWAYEDWLKEAYFDMLKVLEGWCNDEVEYARTRAVTYVYELLKEKPEQESNLLRLLVNKLGDPEKKIASRASYLILQLQTSHPLMKPIIICSIESELLLRPGQNSHAKYYAITTLNQTILSAREEEVARKLLNVYFGLFVLLLKKPEPLKPLPGPAVNRKGQIQGGGGAAGKKAKLKATKEQESKQMHEEMTEKMVSAVLTGVNRALPFSKADDLTLETHMDTLFRITHSSNFNTSIQALMLIEQLSTSKHIATDRFYRTLYESLLDPRLITSSKHALYLNLLFRALKSDINVKRVKAFVKRLLQVVTLHQPPFICGIMYLLRELEATFPGLRSLYNNPEDNQDDEEVYRDVPEDDAELSPQQAQQVYPDHHVDEKASLASYDGRKRDPEHSNADKTCLWELIPFLVHFHPSVSMFASCLMNNEKMPPKPDLASHTLSHFLDRFVYRNAKAAASGLRGNSIMQPLAGSQSGGVLLANRSTHGQQPVNSEAFWRKKAEAVAADEVFFHQYFNQIGKGKQAASKKKDVSTKFSGSGDEEENEKEDEIWQALIDSRPEVEGPSDGSDMEMDDLDEKDMESLADAMESDDDEAGGVEFGDEDGGLDELEDEEALFSSEDGKDSDVGELLAKELQPGKAPTSGKDGQETSRQKKRRLKGLPTFASADDYAKMLEDDGDEDF